MEIDFARNLKSLEGGKSSDCTLKVKVIYIEVCIIIDWKITLVSFEIIIIKFSKTQLLWLLVAITYPRQANTRHDKPWT